MQLKKLILSVVGSLLITSLTPVTVFAVGAGGSCAALYVLPNAAGLRTLSQMPELRLMTYNVENLFVHQGQYERTSAIDMHKKSEPHEKSPEAVQEIANIIHEEHPDLLVLEEVEGDGALTSLNSEYLNNDYKTFMLPGNDVRGIQIGFMLKADLDLQVDLESHKDIMWMDPVDQKEVPLFSRDLPALIVRQKGALAPSLIVLGNHAKSKRNRPGDHESNILRTAQFQGIAEIIRGYQQKFGDKIPIILAGDFNTNVQKSAELAPIRNILQDSFDLTEAPINNLDRVTHTFHPFHGPREAQQMDAVMVNAPLAAAIAGIHVYRYKDAQGKMKPLPATFQDRAKNPSDHFPVIVDISVAPLLAH